jgi:hypothetical protein
MFEQRKDSLLLEGQAVEENLTKLHHESQPFPDKLATFLELAGDAWLSHELAFPEEKREMVKIATSNLLIKGKKVEIEPSFPFQDVANRLKIDDGAPHRALPRTWDRLLNILTTLNTNGQLPDLSSFSYFQDKHNRMEIMKKE